MGELNQSHVKHATDLQKYLNARLVMVSVLFFYCFF